jgi:adenosine deaminase
MENINESFYLFIFNFFKIIAFLIHYYFHVNVIIKRSKFYNIYKWITTKTKIIVPKI